MNNGTALSNAEISLKKEYGLLLSNLNRLLIYKNILNDEIVQCLVKIISEFIKENPDNEIIEKNYYNMTHNLIIASEQNNLSGNLIKSYILELILNDENIFSKCCEKNSQNIQSLREIAFNDLKILKKLGEFDIGVLNINLDYLHTIKEYLPSLNFEKNIFSNEMSRISKKGDFNEFSESIIEYYNKIGSGEMSKYVAFRFDEDQGILGIKNYDFVNMEHIVGYDYQKDVLLKNTETFLSEKPANNILLVGARGTGKSSLVKSLITKYYPKGLRIIEIKKSDLKHLGTILDNLTSKSKKFIIFLDDLSFEDAETEYKELKSVLEGSIEKKPDNVIIYATSNRKHLIKESWKDRENDEIHLSDAQNEKMSLSDRFGISLTFYPPNQEEYLNIVKKLALETGLLSLENKEIDFKWENIRKEAVKWAMYQNGLSGRTAKQFIDYLVGKTND